MDPLTAPMVSCRNHGPCFVKWRHQLICSIRISTTGHCSRQRSRHSPHLQAKQPGESSPGKKLHFVKYKQTTQSCFTLRTYLKSLLHSKNFQLLFIFKNCTKDDLLHKKQFFKIWRSTVFWLHKLSRLLFFGSLSVFSVFHQGQKFFICHVNIHEQKAERWLEASNLHLKSLWMSRHLTILRIATWSMRQHRSSRPGLEPMSLVRRAKTLTTRPPSPYLYCSFLN